MKYFASLLVLVLFIGLASCSQQSTSPTTTSSTPMYNVPMLTTGDINTNVTAGTTQEATLGQNFTFCPPPPPDTNQNPGWGRPPMGGFYGRFTPMAFVFRQLNLTDTQKVEIDTFLVEYKNCIQSTMQTLMQSMQDIMATARSSRDSIISELKAGTIDTATAKSDLRTLNQNTRAAMRTAQQTAAAALKTCRDTLFSNIASILTTDQLVIWNRWASRLG